MPDVIIYSLLPDTILHAILGAIAGIFIVAGGIILVILLAEVIRRRREKRFMAARLAQRRYTIRVSCPEHGGIAMDEVRRAQVEMKGKSTISIPHCGCSNKMDLMVDPFEA